MRSEETCRKGEIENADEGKGKGKGNVIEFPGARESAEPANPARETPDTAQEPDIPPATVLKAERGIINTGTVHGGQHITAVELRSHVDPGADGDF
ncbi:S-type pyocin domain-containing protein [Streptomyces sp. C11-1]|uniref:S-type pyocin domain-containing protein n=1 Tax=Streptomyces durocortorensis TaxID=2811104 RepID=A0ABY9W7Y9_9ACTN|nr:S-type pyocin domain-containing protein [Streptomyces durocortorensis]WNF30122.1 S-type pyocin domain-containing protein [Streptomyces durocortorensis]